jgi:hypothetical protein
MSIVVFSCLRLLCSALSDLFATRRARLWRPALPSEQTTASRPGLVRPDLTTGWMRRGPPGLKPGVHSHGTRSPR